MSYRIQTLTHHPDEITKESQLLRETFDNEKHFSFDFLKWQYLQNPDGAALGFNAYDEKENLAAHYVTQPLRAMIHGQERKGLLSLNTATQTAHAGKGLFTKLANETYQKARSEAYEFIIGVANANSTHGFIRKLGFTLISPLHACIGMNTDALLHASSESENHFDYFRIWNKDSLSWRLANPCSSYGILKNKNTMLISANSGKPLIRAILRVEEKLFDSLNENNSYAKPLNLWIGAGKKPSGYVNIPMRFRPSPLNLIFKDLTGKIQTPDFEKIKFSALDFDAY